MLAKAQAGDTTSHTGCLFQRADTILWPPLIGLTLAGILSSALIACLQWAGDIDTEARRFALGSPELVALSAGLIFLLAYLRANAQSEPGVTPYRAFIAAAAAALICAAMEVLLTHYSSPFIEGGWFIAITLVCLLALPENLADYFPEAPPPPLDAEET